MTAELARPQPTLPDMDALDTGRLRRTRLERLRDYAETTPLNHIRWGDRSIGIVTHSMAYQYAREVFPNASVLKLGMAYPLPRKLIVVPRDKSPFNPPQSAQHHHHRHRRR